MPNPFRVGDRVRRVGIPDGLISNVPNGSIWTVSAVPNDRMITIQDDPNQGSNRFINYFELVEQEVTQPELPQRVHTFYIIVFEMEGGVYSSKRGTEHLAGLEALRIIHDGGIVHAKKKITVRY